MGCGEFERWLGREEAFSAHADECADCDRRRKTAEVIRSLPRARAPEWLGDRIRSAAFAPRTVRRLPFFAKAAAAVFLCAVGLGGLSIAVDGLDGSRDPHLRVVEAPSAAVTPVELVVEELYGPEIPVDAVGRFHADEGR